MFNTIGAIQKHYEMPNVGQISNSHVSPVQGFSEVLQAATGVNNVISELEALGVHVTVRAVPNNHRAVVDNARTVGGDRTWNSVTIAPNIVQKMAEDDGIRQKYTDKILWWQNEYKPSILATTPIHGGRFTGMTKTIHEDGTVTYVLFGQAPHEINGTDDENNTVSESRTSDRTAANTAELHNYYESITVIQDDYLAKSKIAGLTLSEPFIKSYLNHPVIGNSHHAQSINNIADGSFFALNDYSGQTTDSKLISMMYSDSALNKKENFT